MRATVRWHFTGAFVTLLLLAGMATTESQTLPRITWLMAPTTRTLTLSVVGDGDLFAVSGWLDSGGTRSAAFGNAFVRPDGALGMGLTIVFDNDGRSEQMYSVIDRAAFAGTWRSPTAGSGSLVVLNIFVPQPPPEPPHEEPPSEEPPSEEE